MIKSLISNATILFSFLFLAGEIFKNKKLNLSSPVNRRASAGVIAGFCGILLMLFSVKIPPNVVLDLRHFAIIGGAIQGGMIAAIIPAIMMVIFRVAYFGVNTASITALFLIILISIACGIISRFNINKKNKYIFMNIVGISLANLALFILLKGSDILFLSILYFTITSIIVAFVLYYLLNHILLTNALFRKYKAESKISNEFTDLITVHESDGTYKYLSPSCKRILGYDPEELIGTNPYDLFHPNDLAAITKSHSTISETKEDYSVVYRIRKKDGNYIWFETTSRGIGNKNGEIEELICVSRDISQRKRIELELRESNQRIKNILESIQDGFFVLDKNWKFNYINKEAEPLLERRRDGLLGKSIWDEFPELLGSSFYDKYHKALKEEIAINFQEFYPLLNKWFNVRVYPSKRGISVYFHDITEQKKLENELKEVNEKLRSLSFVDGLTNIPNRRYFNEYLEKEWNRSSRNARKLSLLMIDIDHFKAYNDTYGHLQGDECLKTLARTLQNSTKRSGDLAARYGGEEFAIILPETDREGAIKIAERIKKRVEDLNIPNINSGVKPYVTVSVGVASVSPSLLIKYEELIDSADKALYMAKKRGRNRVEVY